MCNCAFFEDDFDRICCNKSPRCCCCYNNFYCYKKRICKPVCCLKEYHESYCCEKLHCVNKLDERYKNKDYNCCRIF